MKGIPQRCNIIHKFTTKPTECAAEGNVQEESSARQNNKNREPIAPNLRINKAALKELQSILLKDLQQVFFPVFKAQIKIFHRAQQTQLT